MVAILKSYAMGPILFSRSKVTFLEVLTLLWLNPRSCQIWQEICSTISLTSSDKKAILSILLGMFGIADASRIDRGSGRVVRCTHKLLIIPFSISS